MAAWPVTAGPPLAAYATIGRMEPRSAATLVLARPGVRGDGVEVLVARRAVGSRFAPGYVVFPGGRLEPGDDERAGRWFADPAQAVRACAVRELAEETGIALTGTGPVGTTGAESALAMVEALPPRADALERIGRWLAPEFLAVRFDAVFFAAVCPRGVDPVADGVELDQAWWAGAAEVLRDEQLWISLMWPTYNVLVALAECRSVQEVLRLRVPQQAPPPDARAPTSPEWAPGPAAPSPAPTPPSGAAEAP